MRVEPPTSCSSPVKAVPARLRRGLKWKRATMGKIPQPPVLRVCRHQFLLVVEPRPGYRDGNLQRDRAGDAYHGKVVQRLPRRLAGAARTFRHGVKTIIQEKLQTRTTGLSVFHGRTLATGNTKTLQLLFPSLYPFSGIVKRRYPIVIFAFRIGSAMDQEVD